MTNNLKHTIDKNNYNVNCKVEIRLNDEHNNGHEDFSITGTFWKVGKSRIDGNMIKGGCCHDEILKHFPKLRKLVNLHLCDYNGIPIHAVSNGFYHLKNNIGQLDPQTDEHADKFCEYYRITKEQFNVLKTSPSADIFAYHLFNLNIFSQWKDEAKKGIEMLENLTGLVFSPKTEGRKVQNVDLKKIEEEMKAGYYLPEKIQEREIEKKAKETQITIDKLKKDAKKDIEDINEELTVKLLIMEKCGLDAVKNIIFYKHSKKIAFNWRGYNNLPKETIEGYKSILDGNLPKGVTIE